LTADIINCSRQQARGQLFK